MTVPASQPYGGLDKWGDVVLDLGLAVVGGVLAWGVSTQLADDLPAMRALGVYTAFAALATAALALARAVTRRRPVLRQVASGDEETWMVRAWPGEWWHATAVDAGLVLLAAYLTVLGLTSEGGWLPLTLPVTVLGLWLLGRVLLTLLGRRHEVELRLTGDEVVQRAPWGELRCPSERVTRVAVVGGRLRLVLDGPGELRLCPRPWRRQRVVERDVIRFDCSSTGHDAAALAEWFRARLGAA